MYKPDLPIDKIIEEEFSKFKKESLDGITLDLEDLEKIKKLFGVGDPKTGSICCDEQHAHSYKCEYYKHPATGIVARLVNEINRYKNRLSKIREYTE